MKSCKFAHTHVLGDIPLCISVPTPYYTSVGEFATFNSKGATFHNVFFAKIIFDNKFDIYVQRLEI